MKNYKLPLFSLKKQANAARPKKNNWLRFFTLIATVGLITSMSACNDDDDALLTGIKPKGEKPAWGPTIAPEMQTVIEALDSLSKRVSLTSLTPQQARMAPTAADAAMAVMKNYHIAMPPMGVDTMGHTIPVAGGTIHARSYRPKTATGALPGIVYYHGGGWVIATIDTYNSSAQALAEQTGAVVVSVEYRKGPEFKFPTAHNDAYAAYLWVRDNAATLNINPAKIAVAGESAGGGLAAAVCLLARDNKVTMPVHQLLVYPIADNNTNTESYNKYADAKPLSKPLMQWFFNNYFRTPADGDTPWVSLVDMADVTGLPSATIINAEIDPLQTEGQQLAAKLKAAGVPVTTKVYEGVTHEFFGMALVVPQAKEAQKLATDELKKAFQ